MIWVEISKSGFRPIVLNWVSLNVHTARSSFEVRAVRIIQEFESARQFATHSSFFALFMRFKWDHNQKKLIFMRDVIMMKHGRISWKHINWRIGVFTSRNHPWCLFCRFWQWRRANLIRRGSENCLRFKHEKSDQITILIMWLYPRVYNYTVSVV